MKPLYVGYRLVSDTRSRSGHVTLKCRDLVLLECADSLLKTVAILNSRDIAVKEERAGLQNGLGLPSRSSSVFGAVGS